MTYDSDFLFLALRHAQHALAADPRGENLHVVINELMQKLINTRTFTRESATVTTRYHLELLEKLSVACLMLMDNHNPYQYLQGLIDEALVRLSPARTAENPAT